MDKSEMRLCRREWINVCLQTNKIMGMTVILILVKGFVRQQERLAYGMELKAYG